MKHKTGRKLLSFLLTLALAVGLLPGMSMTAYALALAGIELTNVTAKNGYLSGFDLKFENVTTNNKGANGMISIQKQQFDDNNNLYNTYKTTFTESKNKENGDFTPTTVDRGFVTWNAPIDGKKYFYRKGTVESEDISNPWMEIRVTFAENAVLLNDNQTYYVYLWTYYQNYWYPDYYMGDITVSDGKLTFGEKTITPDDVTPASAEVTGINLDKTEAQAVTVGEKVSFTASIEPDNASDKKVKWSVSGTNAGAVTLYSDETCNTPVTLDTATDTLTVYAKGISVGSATVTATSNADSSKTASCDVTVNEAQPSSYTLTIPSTLSVANSGWNATSGISATGSLASGKKLTVTASSDGEFALVSGTNKVNYKLAASGDTTTTYANATEKTTWEFATLSDTAATQTMGIVVEDYSTKPAGTYQDTVTFTASVVSAS